MLHDILCCGEHYASVPGTRRGRRVVWEWVQRNWDDVDARFGGGGVSSTLTRIVGASCSGLASEAGPDNPSRFSVQLIEACTFEG